jgi:hypothetical protein
MKWLRRFARNRESGKKSAPGSEYSSAADLPEGFAALPTNQITQSQPGHNKTAITGD